MPYLGNQTGENEQWREDKKYLLKLGKAMEFYKIHVCMKYLWPVYFSGMFLSCVK